MAEANELKCIECGNIFTFLKNLRAHIKKKHPLLKVDEIAPTNKDKNKDLYIFTCDLCSKSYCHEKNLNEHKNITQSSTKTIEILVPCIFCSFTAPYKIMDEHYLKYHNVSQNSINLEFENFNEFEIHVSHTIIFCKKLWFL